MPDIELTYWVKPGEENFAMATALTLSRFVRGCHHDMAQPGLIYITVSPRGSERVKAFFRNVGKELIAEGNAPCRDRPIRAQPAEQGKP